MPTIAAEMTATERVHWLALRLVPGLGARSAVKLIERYYSPEAVFRASRSELLGEGIKPGPAQSIVSGTTFDDAVEQIRLMEDGGVSIVCWQDDDYPPELRNIFDAPLLLFTLGDRSLMQRVQVAIVGTRRPTPYGLAATERLTADLVTQGGPVIISGMARGIDTSAHKTALASGGKTIAVFGCGVDVIYPAENRKLAEQIVREGLVVSEYPLRVPGQPHQFPARNRIISGMSSAVVVVEGAQYSGSAITARLAMEQGRDVFAVPGNITSKNSFGPNLLIKEGARLVQSAEDILGALPADTRRKASLEGGVSGAASTGSGEDAPNLKKILDEMMGPNAATGLSVCHALAPDQSTHIDELMEKVPNCSSSEVIAALFQLELAGLVKQLPGKNFVTVW